jgi:hypothetical protein
LFIRVGTQLQADCAAGDALVHHLKQIGALQLRKLRR